MTNPELVKQFAGLEAHIAESRGDFTLFALFQREEVPDRWDLMIAAPWVGSDRRAAVEYFINEIEAFLGLQALRDLSRIVVLDPNEAAVKALNQAIRAEHGSVEVRDSNFFGLLVKHAYIITSKPQEETPVA
jgi:hypothetical protein